MKCRVIVETPMEELLLLRVLEDLSHETYEIVSAGSPSRCVSIARALLALEHAPVAVVANAESNSSRLVEQQRESIENALLAAPQTAETRVVIVMPHLLMVLLELSGKLEKLAGRKPTPEELPFVQMSPILVQKWLETLHRPSLQQQLPDLIHNLSDGELDAIRKHAAIRELRDFMQQVAKRPPRGQRTEPATI